MSKKIKGLEPLKEPKIPRFAYLHPYSLTALDPERLKAATKVANQLIINSPFSTNDQAGGTGTVECYDRLNNNLFLLTIVYNSDGSIYSITRS